MITEAATLISKADALIITAGAGMGVDSGLPDFRGGEGFWNAYPAYADRGLSFEDCANPQFFKRTPSSGWGFYGHRTNLYRATKPHKGFNIIKDWAKPTFVVTSNVDGQFQKAGYAESSVLEVHGSIHNLQCCNRYCAQPIIKNEYLFTIYEPTMRLMSHLPYCPACGDILRPNILMFNDHDWIDSVVMQQTAKYNNFLNQYKDKSIAVIELGAGSAISTIRGISEQLGWEYANTTVIRINPTEANIPEPHISIPLRALEALELIDAWLKSHK
jgi:NAD-dependent SIR2 family protein deacetylase